MLALFVTVEFALYILGPDLFSRVILGFTIPRKNIRLTRSEEVARALIWAIASIAPATAWAYWLGPLHPMLVATSLRVCLSGLYSEPFFAANRDAWFDNMRLLMWLNLVTLWRVYAITLLISTSLSFLTHHYGRLREWLSPFLRGALASIVLPGIAPWHLLLSGILLKTTDLTIHVDVLTKQDGLYQGRLEDKTLGGDGTLMSITLADPKRFRRADYLAEKQRSMQALVQAPKPNQYWKEIPTNVFVIMGTEIQTMNLRYVPRSMAALKRSGTSGELNKALSELGKAVQAAKKASRQFS